MKVVVGSSTFEPYLYLVRSASVRDVIDVVVHIVEADLWSRVRDSVIAGEHDLRNLEEVRPHVRLIVNASSRQRERSDFRTVAIFREQSSLQARISNTYFVHQVRIENMRLAEDHTLSASQQKNAITADR